jgi:hypothetical protein
LQVEELLEGIEIDFPFPLPIKTYESDLQAVLELLYVFLDHFLPFILRQTAHYNKRGEQISDRNGGEEEHVDDDVGQKVG